MNIYKLKSDVTNYSSFIEDYPKGQESVMGLSRDNWWKPFGANYTPVTLEILANDLGIKNYRFYFNDMLSPFFVLSEFALNSLEDILLPRGELLPVITESKRKKFYGYYPTNPLSKCLDKDNSIYKEYPNGLLIRKCVLIESEISDEYLFSIEEDISSVFVTEKFKQRISDAGLLGFDFSHQVELS